MKKLLITLLTLMAFAYQAKAMSFEQARQQALFLTDKMAYELNLTDDQYEAAYEINLDYLLSIDHYDDLYGIYWRRRNLDLSYILYEWQYRAYCQANYFYRPLYYDTGYWRFRIYARYPYRDYYYFGRPVFYNTYRGSHSWHMNNGQSWYSGRQFGGARSYGMRDGFQRGDYGRGYRFGGYNDSNYDNYGYGYNTPQWSGSRRDYGSYNYDNPNAPRRSYDNRYGSGRNFGNGDAWNNGYERQSSTRSTARGSRDYNDNPGSGHFGGARFFNGSGTNGSAEVPNNTFSPNRSQGSQPSTSGRSFGGNTGGSSFNGMPQGFTPFSGTRSQGSTGSTPSTSGRSFGGGGNGGGSFTPQHNNSNSSSGTSGSGHFGGRR